jgi:hypothetical protein
MNVCIKFKNIDVIVISETILFDELALIRLLTCGTVIDYVCSDQHILSFVITQQLTQ